jgi:hypothetical protein
MNHYNAWNINIISIRMNTINGVYFFYLDLHKNLLHYILFRFASQYFLIVGRNSSAGIATRYELGRSGDRIPVRARFSAPV